ncbi:DNRLRE domain-containing protein [Solirubrobacter sp. CPCC 204708]|uniref:DNRLRE domain-containing protein n=1 Tax=Solirubrobacter deserti TaxID=2282478 RepID=A0ABT4RM99_9ACTN|nr:DNRLRE domain-containing protein [Solirubrobacter deserti]MBE2320400.1 DNRLRE domain-containing protein [Solirubrobacter deserti]MDA0139405.1 DNRLRE domain-containing protein [Solirubrobacter deserti]
MSSQACANQATPLVGKLAWSPWNDRYRAVAKFDFSQIPTGSEIVSAHVVVDWSWYDTPSSSWIYLHELTAPFTAGATWTKRDGVNSWASAGGDFLAQEAAPPDAGYSGEDTEWGSFEITNLVRRWYTGTSPNHGVLFKAGEEGQTANDVVEMENLRLLLTYAPPDTAAPGVDAGGELVGLDGRYTKQTSAVVAVSAEDDSRGVSELRVVDAGEASLGGALLDCGSPRVCDTEVSEAFAVNLAGLSGGKHVLRATARDDANNVGTSESWEIIIDRQAPGMATDIDASKRSGQPAQVLWVEPEDPDLADGSPGSGTSSFSYRYRLNSGAWSAWTQTTVPRFAVDPAVVGHTIAVEIKSIDAAGNEGPVASATTNVVVNDSTARSKFSIGELVTDGAQARTADDPEEPPVAYEWDFDPNQPDVITFCTPKFGMRHSKIGTGVRNLYNAVRFYGTIRCWNNGLNSNEKKLSAQSGYRAEVCLYSVSPRRRLGECVTEKASPRKNSALPKDDDIPGIIDVCTAGNRDYVIEVEMVGFGPTIEAAEEDELKPPGFKTLWPFNCNEPGAWRAIAYEDRDDENKNPGYTLGGRIVEPPCYNSPNFPGNPCDDHPTGGSRNGTLGWNAHHIIPANEGANVTNVKVVQAERAMTYAYSCGLSANNAPNGVWLRGSSLWSPTHGYKNLLKNHPTAAKRPRHALHREDVYEAVADALDAHADLNGTCHDAAALSSKLQGIKDGIADASWPHLPATANQP